VVKVLKTGFEYADERYTSFSAVARDVTGTPWNGLSVFGSKKREPKRTKKNEAPF